MKLNKLQFKKILKECIRELISEGAFDTVVNENLSLQHSRPAANDFVGVGAYSTGDTNSNGSGRSNSNTTSNTRLDELSRAAAAQCAKGDPKQAAMMESIFADTARTTLQRQLGSEGAGGGDVYLGEVEDPQEEAREMAALDVLSGGRGAKHWAALAFGKYGPKE